jgi:ribosomal protein S18 acetylase RimI-like enzyme
MEIARIQSADDPRFDMLLRIYAEALPASERKSADALRRMIARPEYFFLAAIEEAALVGFSIAIAFVDSDAALLEYLAVDAKRRGKGLGEMLFRATAGRSELRGRFLLCEVESEAANETDAAIRARRKNFYRRLGAKQIEGLSYIMPPVSSALPPAMDMLAIRNEMPGSIEKSHVRAWLNACYRQVYDVSEDDVRIDAMLGGLQEIIRLI